MYSLLLMSAMAGAPETPAFGGFLMGGCHGVVTTSCAGCYGTACYGGSYSAACTGSYYSAVGCGGCGGCGGLFSGLQSRLSTLFHGGHSCGGFVPFTSCCGSGYYYGTTSCTGCYGSPYYSAYGGCYGSCHGYLPAYPVYHGGPGYLPAYPVGGACLTCAVPAVPVVDGIMVGSAGPDMSTSMMASRPESGTGGLLASAPADAAAPARLSIELPAKAILYVDGVKVAGTGDTRQFHTPELPVGKAFYYELKAEVIVNGQREVEEKKVIVRAGDRLTEAFPKLLAATRAPARPTVVAAK